MTASLTEQMAETSKRNALIDDALLVLNAEVSDKSGLSGMAIKAAFKVVQGIQPGFLRRVIAYLLDDFLLKMDPFYQEAISSGKKPGALVESQKSKVAEALLTVTDRRAAEAGSEVVKKTYQKLRPTAQKHVESAAPRLAGLLDRHAVHA